MKRVRTLAGAVGLAPLAIGAAVAPAAPRAAAAPAAGGNAKTVSLSHAACSGSVYAATTNTDDQSRMHLWYKGEGNGLTCIGTVAYSEWSNSRAGEQMRIRIRVPPGGNVDYSGFFNGRIASIPGLGRGDVFSHGVHLDYGAGNVQVCTAQVPASDHNVVTKGPICITVP
jgi:hypothetical protein